MDAFRYIATGDINQCIIKPKKADVSNLYATENEGPAPSEKENKGPIAKQPVAQVNRTPSCEAIKRKQIAKQPDAEANRTPSPIKQSAKQPDAEANRTPSSPIKQSAKQPDAEANRTPSSTGAIRRKPTVQIGDSPEWLPSGWITEIKTQQSGQHAGSTYQCFFNPFTETRFYSKKKVLRYLESEELRRPSTNKETSRETNSAGDFLTSSNRRGSIKNKEINTETHSAGDILTSSTQTGSIDNKGTNNTVYSSDELPDGWVKEIRLRYSKSGAHKDPYYIDPVGEYAFRSRKDALRYLKTGDIKKCAMRPKKKHLINIPVEKERPVPKKGRGHQTNKPLPVHRKGQGCQKHRDQPVDSQKKRSAAQLCLRKTKSFKAIALPIRSSKRLAGMKLNHVADSRTNKQLDEPEAMPIVELDFFEKREAKEPSKVEETKLSGDGMVKNQEGSAIALPDQSLVRADHVVDSGRVTSKPEQNLLTSVEGSVGKSDVSKTVPVVDLDSSGKLEEMDAKPEQLPVTQVQDAVQTDGKSDVREAPPTVDEGTMASKFEKLPMTVKPEGMVAKKSKKLPVAKKPKKLPVMPGQSGTKSEEAVPTVNKGAMASKPEKLPATPDQSDGKSAEWEVLPTVDEGTMANKSEKLDVGTMASKSEKLPVTPFEGADKSGAKSELETAPTVNLDFFEKLVAEEHPEVGERKPTGDTPDSPLILPFGDSWSDPCLEFAFKTLTGDIPVLEDTALIEDYFQQQLVQSSSPVAEPRGSGGTLENGSKSGRKRKASDEVLGN